MPHEEQARKDEADRKAIVESLTDKLKGSDKALVGNKGYRKYLPTSEGKHGAVTVSAGLFPVIFRKRAP